MRRELYIRKNRPIALRFGAKPPDILTTNTETATCSRRIDWQTWRSGPLAVLGRQVAAARQIVTKLVDGRVTFQPEECDGRAGFRFQATGTIAKLLDGVIYGGNLSSQGLASPPGIAERCTLEISGKVAA